MLYLTKKKNKLNSMLTEGVIKIEAEINEIGNKKPIEKIIKPSIDSLESSIKFISHLASLMKKKK